METPIQQSHRPSILTRLRAWLIAGLLVTVPLYLTFVITVSFVTFVDRKVAGLIPPPYNPNTYLPFWIPGSGLIIVLVFLIVVGMVARNYLGGKLVHLWERILDRMPIVRSIYGASKQIMETVFADKSRAFRDVVMFEYPRKGMWVMGFVTGETQGEVQGKTATTVVNVFLPTTPNPTSGFLLFIPKEDLIYLDMAVEDGIKMIVSGGIVAPGQKKRPENKKN
ncbi:MAG: DUF502 domain-containing protein [Rhodospirillales bacterium]|nr:DUF502 domain-containing protein [Alphaproteobacteria bacterium]MCB9986207.1 DUF502 domain-containing protein [Rhodospirillales bacterium]USO07236.1 MAG: DUF502 domain-containing protein [Rhodospirillales bacterium]